MSLYAVKNSTVYETDGIAAYHSPIVGRLLGPAVRRERQKRAEIVMRRVSAAVSEKRLSETVIVQTEAVREGLRRRSHASTFQDMLGIRQVRQASEEGITVVRQA